MSNIYYIYNDLQSTILDTLHRISTDLSMSYNLIKNMDT